MNECKYALRYLLETEARPEGYTKEDCIKNVGLTDSLLITSIVSPEDGSYSQSTFGFDGKKNRDMTQQDVFKAWMLLGVSLHNEKKLRGWQKLFVQAHSELVKKLFKKTKKQNEGKLNNEH